MSNVDTRTASLKSPINVAEYLYQRLHQVGIRNVFGVPGDYNLVALDYLEPNGLKWVGNANELGAAYAADGYARVKGISAIITTFGVGELSALNGIAGSYSEYVPVVHIVGTPSTISQKNGMLLHHTLGNGDYNVFTNMSANISCAVSRLNDAASAAELIDHAIRECYLQSRPVYITLPTDMVLQKVEGDRLKTKIDLTFAENDKEKEDYCVQDCLRYLKESQNPVILVDACAIRHRALEEVHELVKTSGLPTFTTPMGKGAVDETLPNFGGVYAGDGSNLGVREIVESADLVLTIGSIKSDFNTAGFTYKISNLSTIDFHSTHVDVKWATYQGIRMNNVLRRVTKEMKKFDTKPVSTHEVKKPEENGSDDVITHAWLWPHFTAFFKENDIILTETGTSGYGIFETRFGKQTMGISQVLWGSIGFAFGASMGAALAAKELGNKRTILFTGEGSFQLTVQELSTIIRHKLTPIIIIIENEGYTIERMIHGMDATYNDIGTWRYSQLPSAFGAEEGSYKTYDIKTKQQLRDLLQDEEFAQGDLLRWVVLHMPKDDAPVPLKLTAEASAKNNARLD